MNEDTLRERAEAWRRRALDAWDARTRAANQRISDHYAALADRIGARGPGPGPAEDV